MLVLPKFAMIPIRCLTGPHRTFGRGLEAASRRIRYRVRPGFWVALPTPEILETHTHNNDESCSTCTSLLEFTVILDIFMAPNVRGRGEFVSYFSVLDERLGGLGGAGGGRYWAYEAGSRRTTQDKVGAKQHAY